MGLGGTTRTGGEYLAVDDRSSKITRVKDGGLRPFAHRERALPPAAVFSPATDPTFSSALEFKTKNPGTVKIWLDQSTKTRGKGLPSFHRHLEFAGVVHRAAGQICDMLFIRSTSVAVPSAGPPLSSPTFSAGALFPCGGGGSPWEKNPSRKQDSPQFKTTIS